MGIAKGGLNGATTERTEGGVAGASTAERITEVVQREMVLVEMRMGRMWEEIVRTRGRVVNLEGVLGERPEVREALKGLPGDLKRLSPETVPFPAPLWSQDRQGGADELLKATPSGALVKRRAEEAVAYLEAHPEATVAEAAQRCHVSAGAIYRSARYRDFRAARGLEDPRNRSWVQTGHTSGVERALEYLATHRPRTAREVALAVNTSPSNLTSSPRFRRAWAAYVAGTAGSRQDAKAQRTADGAGRQRGRSKFKGKRTKEKGTAIGEFVSGPMFQTTSNRQTNKRAEGYRPHNERGERLRGLSVFDPWSLSGIWCLGFGVFGQARPGRANVEP
jgi:hypothetical protein